MTQLWMGLDNPELSLDELQVAVVGIPYDGSVSHAAGAAEAPAVLRDLSKQLWPYSENLVSLEGLRLRDLGDVAVNPDDAFATQRAITAMIKPLARASVIPVVLGGDHSVTSAVVAAFADCDDLGVLWMDSHPDLMDTFGSIRNKEESPWSHACPLRRICELPNVQADNVLLLGVRDFIPQELQYIREQGLEVIYAREVSRMSAHQLAERIGHTFAGVSGVYISFDIDVLDPAFAPGTGVPIPGGISSRYLYDLILQLFEREEQSLRRSGEHFLQVVGFDLVEIAPPLDVGRITSLAGMGIVTNMLGYLALQLGLSGAQ